MFLFTAHITRGHPKTQKKTPTANRGEALKKILHLKCRVNTKTKLSFHLFVIHHIFFYFYAVLHKKKRRKTNTRGFVSPYTLHTNYFRGRNYEFIYPELVGLTCFLRFIYFCVLLVGFYA